VPVLNSGLFQLCGGTGRFKSLSDYVPPMPEGYSRNKEAPQLSGGQIKSFKCSVETLNNALVHGRHSRFLFVFINMADAAREFQYLNAKDHSG
jgi:hypothetical protein